MELGSALRVAGIASHRWSAVALPLSSATNAAPAKAIFRGRKSRPCPDSWQQKHEVH